VFTWEKIELKQRAQHLYTEADILCVHGWISFLPFKLTPAGLWDNNHPSHWDVVKIKKCCDSTSAVSEEHVDLTHAATRPPDRNDNSNTSVIHLSKNPYSARKSAQFLPSCLFMGTTLLCTLQWLHASQLGGSQKSFLCPIWVHHVTD
jgi:hypothetical protein